jgi:hypothetical protein
LTNVSTVVPDAAPLVWFNQPMMRLPMLSGGVDSRPALHIFIRIAGDAHSGPARARQ